MEVHFVEECVRQMLLPFSGPQYSGHSKRKDQVFWESEQTNKQQTLATSVHPFLSVVIDSNAWYLSLS